MKQIILLFMVVLCMGLNQYQLGAFHAIKNFFMTPVNVVKSLFSDAEYEKNSKTTKLATIDENEKMRYCLEDGKITQLQGLEQVLNQVAEKSCNCETWGNCPTEICSCQKQCPQGFNIFRKIKVTSEDEFAFMSEDIKGIKTGYCWGHAQLLSKFDRLAFYKPELKAPFDINSADENEQLKAINYYKNLITKITDNQAVDIPGFADLQSFSDHPAMQSALGDEISEGWAKNAMSWQGLAVSSDLRQQPIEKYAEFMKEVKERLDMRMQPTIVFTKLGKVFSAHSVLVSSYEPQANGTTKLCVRDSNWRRDINAKCGTYMTYDPKEGLKIEGDFRQIIGIPDNFAQGTDFGKIDFDKVAAIQIAHNENPDSNAQVESLRKKCLKERNCKED